MSFRGLVWIAYALLLAVILLLAAGCTNSPLEQRVEMPEGLVVTLKFKSLADIQSEQAKNPAPENYKAHALTWMVAPKQYAEIWMPPGVFDAELFKHELRHANGERHDRNGNWLTR